MNKTITENLSTGIDYSTIQTGVSIVYPNPFSDKIHIKIERTQTEKLTITITDMKGSLLYLSDAYYTNEEVIIQEEMPMGVLLVQVSIAEETKRFKIIKIDN